MYKASTKVRVRYAETDQMAYVYYGNYATYYEIARVEALRQLGFNYKELERQGIMMPVMSLNSNYHAPATYDEVLEIEVAIPNLPRVRMEFEYTIRNEKKKVINTGSTTLVFINMETNRPSRAPESITSLLESYFDER